MAQTFPFMCFSLALQVGEFDVSARIVAIRIVSICKHSWMCVKFQHGWGLLQTCHRLSFHPIISNQAQFWTLKHSCTSVGILANSSPATLPGCFGRLSCMPIGVGRCRDVLSRLNRMALTPKAAILGKALFLWFFKHLKDISTSLTLTSIRLWYKNAALHANG